MARNVKTNLGLALRALLKPLVRLMVSQGITHGDFSEALKDVYVEVSLRYFVDKKLNKSKIAVLTGLTRKEVASVIDRAMRAEPPSRDFSRPSRVLSGWYNDPDYNGPYGLPLEIPYENPDDPGTPPSFVHLVKTYSGDMSPKAMLDELQRGGAVLAQDNGVIKVLRRTFEPRSLSPALIERFGDVVSNIISTVASNVEKEASGTGLFDRVVFSDNPMSQNELEVFDTYLKHKGQEFLETVDIWCSSNVTEKKESAAHRDSFNTGVAMVQYVEWHPEDKESLHELLVSMGYGEVTKEAQE